LDGFYSKGINDLSSSEEVMLEDILLEIEAVDTHTKTTINIKESENVEEEDSKPC